MSTLSHELSISRVRVSQLEDDVESARGQIIIMSGRKDEEGQTEGEETIRGIVPVGGYLLSLYSCFLALGMLRKGGDCYDLRSE